MDDNDGNTSNPATVTIDYATGEPFASDDNSTGNATGTAVTIDPLGNDNDPDGTLDPTSVMLLDPSGNPVTNLSVPGEGAWTVDPTTGAITFTPESGFIGDPTPITYTVDDNEGNTSNAATVTVDYVQQPPVVTDDVSTGNTTGSPVSINPLGNDNDPDGNLDPTSVMLVDPSGNPVTSLAVPGEGTWTVDPTTGEITFTPEPGFVGDPTPVAYTVDDNDGNTSDPATVTIDYDTADPFASNDSSTGNATGTAVTIDPLGNDNDADGTLDPTSVRLVDPSGNPVTALTVPGEGVWAVDPVTGAITFTPSSGFTGDPTPITYTVDDNDGNTSNPATVTIDYGEQPPVATDDSSTGNPNGQAVTIDPLAADNDPDGNLDPSTVKLIDPAGNTVTTLTVAGEGIWVVDPTSGAITFTPEAGFTLDPTPITYTIDDNDDNTSNPATVTIDYDPAIIDAVDVTINSPADGDSGGTLPVNVLTNDTINGAPVDPAAITLVPVTTGPLTVNADGTVTLAPNTPAGTYTVTYEICEVQNPTNCDTATVTVPVIVNLPPVVTNDASEPDQPLGEPVTIDVLGNDSDPESQLDPTSVMIQDASGNPVTTLVVPGEGTWTVNPTTGAITFTPEPGFMGDPTPINYTVKDTDGLESNPGTVTIDYEAPAAITGVVWLDRDKDGTVDANEDRKAGWTLKIKDADGNVVATTVTDAQGNYSVTGLIPAEYTVEFFNTNGVLITSQSTDGPLVSGETVNLPLPIDPSGVVYDSTSREPVEGVTLQLVNSQGTPVHASCLGEGQQNQVTTEDGLYAFDVLPDAHPSCASGDTYTVQITSAPTGYFTDSTIIPPQSGVFDSDASESNCTVDAIANSGSCEVQAQPDAPQGNQATTYYTDFSLSLGDTDVIFNHIPIDLEVARNTELDDNTVLLSKSANKQQISVGDQLYYTIRAENTTEDDVEIDVRDDLPTGFKLTASTVKLTRAGADGNFGTADDVTSLVKSSGFDPVRFGPIALGNKEKVQIGYLVKIGTAAVQGNATNRAQSLGTGSDTDIASNLATATVAVVADTVIDQSTLIGKVFHDRDGDGYQDPANVTGITVKSDYFGWNSLHLGGLNARGSVTADPAKHRKVIRMPWGSNNAFKVTTQQGTVIDVDQYGNLSESHVGLKAKGLTAQDIRLTTKRTRGIPTQTPVVAMRKAEKVMDVLEISITNFGIQEEGLPGVRLATAKGLVIETDGHGRYHLPDVDGGRRSLGKNFIIKLDEATIPEGARITTENPRVLRLSSSALNKINFGVQLLPEQSKVAQSPQRAKPSAPKAAYQSVAVNLGNGFFVDGHHHIRKDHYRVMDDIAAKIKQYGHAHITIDAQHNRVLEKRRVHSVKAHLQKRLGQPLMQNVKIDVGAKAQ